MRLELIIGLLIDKIYSGISPSIACSSANWTTANMRKRLRATKPLQPAWTIVARRAAAQAASRSAHLEHDTYTFFNMCIYEVIYGYEVMYDQCITR